MMTEAGSFARLTLEQRWPRVARGVAEEIPEAAAAIARLLDELPDGKIRPLQDAGSDAAAWEGYLAPYRGCTWWELPWLFAEFYFYRRLLEATDYVRTGIDPFAADKQTELDAAVADLVVGGGIDEIALPDAVLGALWGNRADLSLTPGEQRSRARGQLLVDERAAIARALECESCRRVEIVLDNAGAELLSDLRLASCWLEGRRDRAVRLHAKTLPAFVSDATPADIELTLARIVRTPDLRAWGERLQEWRDRGRVRVCADPFWVAPLAFWQMPLGLRDELAAADFVLLKGDANYRRLLGDCQWPFATPLAEIACYFPAPGAVLRALKSELVAGIAPETRARARAADPDWLVDGGWGVVQSFPAN